MGMPEADDVDEAGAAAAGAAIVGITPKMAAAIIEGVSGLTTEVTALRRSVEQDRGERVEENRLRDKRITWSRRMVVGSLLAAVLAIGVAVFAVVLAARFHHEATAAQASADAAKAAAATAQAAVDQANADRADRSRGSCIQFNVQQKATRAANVQLLVEGFRPFVQPGDEAKLAQFQAGLESIAQVAWPYRDCSPAGIDDFLKNPPVDPATQPPGG